MMLEKETDDWLGWSLLRWGRRGRKGITDGKTKTMERLVQRKRRHSRVAMSYPGTGMIHSQLSLSVLFCHVIHPSSRFSSICLGWWGISNKRWKRISVDLKTIAPWFRLNLPSLSISPFSLALFVERPRELGTSPVSSSFSSLPPLTREREGATRERFFVLYRARGEGE